MNSESTSIKEQLAKEIAARVKPDEVVGLGSGSTTELALKEIGKRIRDERIRVFGIPTSHQTALVASMEGIHVLSGVGNYDIAWAFDGADEVDPHLNMIKGRGGAMLLEKIIAQRARKLVIIVSPEKLVQALGEKFPVPIEIIPGALPLVEKKLQTLGAKDVTVRSAVNKYGPEISEHNNLILDVRFYKIEPGLEREIKLITGVVESGLFFDLHPELLVAK